MVVSGCIPLSDLSLDCAETSTDALMIRRPMLQIILWLTALLAIWMVLGFAIWSRATNGLWPPWTGIGEYVGPHHSADQLFQREKTLWDWLQLLVVPAALAILVFWLNGRRAQTDHEIAEEKSQDELVVKYLELMSQLLLDDDLRNSEQDLEVRNVAGARTLDVLRKLKPARKPDLLRFLYTSGLIDRRVKGAVLSLKNADLSDVDFEAYSDVDEETHWQGVNLFGARLTAQNSTGVI